MMLLFENTVNKIHTYIVNYEIMFVNMVLRRMAHLKQGVSLSISYDRLYSTWFCTMLIVLSLIGTYTE